jgi:hypothetical protein
MKWQTRERVGIDRMGSAWLIKRFVDPEAQFSFLPGGGTPDPEHGEPFDMPGVRLTHRGSHCTFHTILAEYRLDDGVLHRIANIIDEADVTQEVNVESVAAGLDVICRGMRLISPDDLTAIERGQLIYDALYAQLDADFGK